MRTTSDKLHTELLKSFFRGKTSFAIEEILDFYRKREPKLKTTTLNWRIYHLVHSGILARIGRGKFTLGEGRYYAPSVSSGSKSLYHKLHEHFPFLSICVWNTSILNEFMVHQLARFFTIVEVEKEAMESVFHFLKENNLSAFLNPDADIINNYVLGEKNPIIIKQLVSEAPVETVRGVPTVTMEKLLVDIFSDEVIFAAQQGAELETIFREALEKYTVNENRMLRYANRKRKKETLGKYLLKVSRFDAPKLNGHKVKAKAKELIK